MSLRKITRRDALGMIAKTGVMLGAGTCFFLSLKTQPLAGPTRDWALDQPVGQKDRVRRPKVHPTEKVVISGSGSTVIFQISGPAGRHCGISYATTDSKRNYKPVLLGRGVIGKDGFCTVQVDVKSLPSQKVYLRVVTSSTSNFAIDVKGTKAFEIQVSNGVITGFLGTTQRPIEDAGIVTNVAAAGYQR